MEIDIKEINGVIAAELKGSLDSQSAAACKEALQPLFDKADGKLLIDCKELEFISSSGLRLFLALYKETVSKGGEISFENVNSEIKCIFELTGFAKSFNIK